MMATITMEERVEVCYNQTYHPVCDDGWTDNDAAVVCITWGYIPTTVSCFYSSFSASITVPFNNRCKWHRRNDIWSI